MNLLIVIPVLNEAEALGAVVREANPFGTVLVVDDGSTDASAEIAALAGAEVIRHSRNLGKGRALETGFREAARRNAEWVVTLDGDGQHDPREIADLLAPIREDDQTDIVLGNRMGDVADMPLIRRWTNRGMSWLLSRIMRQPVPDTQTGFRAIRVSALEQLSLRTGGFAAESEMLLRLADAGARITSVPVRTIYKAERSEIRPLRDTVRFLQMLWAYWREFRPAKFRSNSD